jgi:hypothetical protein
MDSDKAKAFTDKLPPNPQSNHWHSRSINLYQHPGYYQ